MDPHNIPPLMDQVGQSVLHPLDEEMMGEMGEQKMLPPGIGMDVDYFRENTHPVFY